MAASPLTVDDPEAIRGKRVLVVEDGPTLTHGEMKYGAGTIAAQQFGAPRLVDPRPYRGGHDRRPRSTSTPTSASLLPAMGYGGSADRGPGDQHQHARRDLVVIGTPIDLRRIVNITIPAVRVTYELREIGHPTLRDVLTERVPSSGPTQQVTWSRAYTSPASTPPADGRHPRWERPRARPRVAPLPLLRPA